MSNQVNNGQSKNQRFVQGTDGQKFRITEIIDGKDIGEGRRYKRVVVVTFLDEEENDRESIALGKPNDGSRIQLAFPDDWELGKEFEEGSSKLLELVGLDENLEQIEEDEPSGENFTTC